jgi:hypothetical protein
MPTVFFSWQRDTSATEGRNFIERALERAIGIVAADVALEEAVREGLEVDRDTKGVAGQPPIVDTIFRKIDAAAVFVPDLTFVGKRSDGRPTPNPNVLIEYGWALHSLGYSRIVAVMNVAHGAPGEDMPFDMRHLRWPLTYNLPDGADEATRTAEREKLAKALAAAIRAILESQEYRSSLPRPPSPPPFSAALSSDGPAQFRAPGIALGVRHDSLGLSTSQNDVIVTKGPAIWLRLMPAVSPGRTWRVTELEAALTNNNNILLPIRRMSGSYHFVRADDGFGTYASGNLENSANSFVFAFTTGEIWTADFTIISKIREYSGRSGQQPGLPVMEREFKASLDQYGRLLKRLGLSRPFRWIGGYEGMKGMGLFWDPRPGHYFQLPGPFGSSAADIVEVEGTLEEDMSPAQALKPLFVKLFDACGIPRPDYLDEMNNPKS